MPNRSGVGAQIVGALAVGVAGLFVVAGIYQLNKNQGAGVASDTTSIANNVTSNIFK